MNLRKIIREEIDKGYYIIEDEDGFMLIHYEDLLKVEPHLYKIIKYLPTVDFDEARDLYYKYLNNPITESEEDEWDWVRDYLKGSDEIFFRENDRVLVRNTGEIEEFVTWLGDYGDKYEMGSYGTEITGTVIHDNSDDHPTPSFRIREERTGDRIVFPYKEYQKYLNEVDHDYGNLRIEYHPLSYETPITESEDDLDWIRDVQPVQPITELKPGDHYKIVEISGEAEKDYLAEPDLAGLDPNTIFHLDNSSNFYSKEEERFSDTWSEGFDEVWIANEGSLQCGWVNVDTIMVVKV